MKAAGGMARMIAAVMDVAAVAVVMGRTSVEAAMVAVAARHPGSKWTVSTPRYAAVEPACVAGIDAGIGLAETMVGSNDLLESRRRSYQFLADEIQRSSADDGSSVVVVVVGAAADTGNIALPTFRVDEHGV